MLADILRRTFQAHALLLARMFEPKAWPFALSVPTLSLGAGIFALGVWPLTLTLEKVLARSGKIGSSRENVVIQRENFSSPSATSRALKREDCRSKREICRSEREHLRS